MLHFLLILILFVVININDQIQAIEWMLAINYDP